MITQDIRDPHTVPVEFISTTQGAIDALGNLRTAQAVALDTETPVERDEDGKIVKRDLDVDVPDLRVISIAASFDSTFGPVVRAWVLDMAYIDASALQSTFDGIKPWGWNVPFDRKVLAKAGLRIERWWDAMLFDAVLKQGAYFANGARAWYTSLEVASRRWANVAQIDGKLDTRFSYTKDGQLSSEQIRYAADDSIVTLWTGAELVAQTRKHNLYEAAVRQNDGQPVVDGMGAAGVPFDVSGYQVEVDAAKVKADAAAEAIAIATTGKNLLLTVARWAATQEAAAGRHTVGDDEHAQAAYGLTLVHDEARFGEFLAAVRIQLGVCREQMAALTGAGQAQEDLFHDEPSFKLAFDPDNETEIRRWISKAAPVFTAEFIAASGGSNKTLVKAHALPDVYHAMGASSLEDVTAELKQLALVLASYSRYSNIVAAYADVVGPVRLKPEWNINSGDQLKAMLNEYAAAEVAAYTLAKGGHAHPLGKADPVDSDALSLIGGPLCAALLTFRKQDKIVTTYGDELIRKVHPATRRVHGKYTQALTGTGRLASYSPNMQNLAPMAKPFITPLRDEFGRVVRVLVRVDLSQAELRFAADMSQDKNMLTAFRTGEDLHERTAALMNSIDMKTLKAAGDIPLHDVVGVDGIERFTAHTPNRSAAKLYKELRSKAKAVAFGYAYGLKGASLSKQLTVAGVPTTKEEADELLAKFDVAYPQLATWMAGRVKFISDLSDAFKDSSVPSGCDFEASWRLHRLYARALSVSKVLANKLGRTASTLEIAAEMVSEDTLRASLAAKAGVDVTLVTDEQVVAARALQGEQIAWALGHYGSAVLADDGTPWSFESRTVGQSRRLFQIGTKDWVFAMVQLIVRSKRAHAVNLKNTWLALVNEKAATEHLVLVEAGKAGGSKPKQLSLTKVNPRTGRAQALSREELEKTFEGAEGDALKTSFVSYVLDAYTCLPQPQQAREALFRHAMAERIRAMGNQYRNHPIQGGVADAVMDAYKLIHDELSTRFPGAQLIQSVHDSVVVECDLADAQAIRELVVRHMEACLAKYCPTVPCVADGDVALSLDDGSVLSDDQLQELIVQLALAA